MNIVELAITPFKKYATFSGRARRKEYWSFVLLIVISFFIVVNLSDLSGSFLDSDFGFGLFVFYILAVVVPYISLVVRRLHDQGKSGAWIFIYFVPIIGGIWFLILMLTAGQHGTNKYGPDPKLETGESEDEDTLDADLFNESYN